MRKPPLTPAMVDWLRTLAAYASAQADAVGDEGTRQQRETARRVYAARDWIFDLCNWYDAKRESELRERAERNANHAK
jgi:hypothetical protein